MKALALLVFIPLQLLFVPLAIVGLALATYKQLLISKRLGVSQTGIDVMSGRWTMHEFGMREDEATVRMASVLPNYSPLGMWMVLFPLWVYSRIAGGNSIYPRQVAPGQEDMRDLVTARTRYFDAIIERRMPEVEQFVVMGAGYDTRCYGALASWAAAVLRSRRGSHPTSEDRGARRRWLRDRGRDIRHRGLRERGHIRTVGSGRV